MYPTSPLFLMEYCGGNGWIWPIGVHIIHIECIGFDH